ncbi:MAG: HAD-IA family hydrolase, partial [Candidatus Woesearchaeota archaeon]
NKALKASYKELKKYENISLSRFLKLYSISRREIHRELSGTASAHNRVLYFQRMMEKIKGKVNPSIILKLSDAYWDNFLQNMKLSKGSIEVLNFCKENDIKTAIVSDLTTKIQLKKLEKLKISNYIDVLVTSEEAGSEKPHSIMFLLTLNKLNVMPQDALMIGDNEIADIEGANFVGLTTVLLKKKILSLSKDDYRRPTFAIKNIKDLINIINNLNLKRVSEEGYIKFDCTFNKTKPINKNKIEELNFYRQKLYDLKLIGAYKNKIGFGNISIRDKKNIIISGSTTGNIKKLNNEHYSIITNYNIHKNKLFCKGGIKASSESMTHAAIYELDENINAVIHIHNLKMWKKYLNKLPTTSVDASYGTPEIAFEIQKLYHKGFKEKKIAVLGGHKEGIISFGKDLKEAYEKIIKYY